VAPEAQNILQRKSLLGDRAGEKVSDVSTGGVHLILAGRDVELLDEILEDSDGLSSLLAGDGRDRSDINSRHFGSRKIRNFEGNVEDEG
jgi:hypothetical protein